MTATLSQQSSVHGNLSYGHALEHAQHVNWKLSDVVGGDKRLDFNKNFLPEALAGVGSIRCLNDQEKRLLNQIRASSYLHVFDLVEEFILPTVIEHVEATGLADITATQALLHFAEEESKHIHLFRVFAEEFDQGFGTACGKIGPVQEITAAVLKHRRLAVVLIILYIEWMTQYHYQASFKDNDEENLDPQFCSLLKHHWLEEAQHTALDTLIVEQLVSEADQAELQASVDDFFAILAFLEGGLRSQLQLDLDSLSLAIGRELSPQERAEIESAQLISYHWTFIGSGLSHPRFLETFSTLLPLASDRLAEETQRYTAAR